MGDSKFVSVAWLTSFPVVMPIERKPVIIENLGVVVLPWKKREGANDNE